MEEDKPKFKVGDILRVVKLSIHQQKMNEEHPVGSRRVVREVWTSPHNKGVVVYFFNQVGLVEWQFGVFEEQVELDTPVNIEETF